MECAARGMGASCTGPATRRCGNCGAVGYCSPSHQISHWSVHKEECARLARQMSHIDPLHDFPFTFSAEATLKVSAKDETRCSFLKNRGLHQVGIWKPECCCWPLLTSLDHSWMNDNWNLSSSLCPCTEPTSPITPDLRSWRDYYCWRNLPLHSPVALLLHWPLSIYYGIQLSGLRNKIISGKLHIHYLGLDKELHQLAVFGELHALFPHYQIHIEIIGPAVPQSRDGERINLCNYAHCLETECPCKSLSQDDTSSSSLVTLQLRKGLYHDQFRDVVKDSFPHIIVAPNAGIAAYSSWLPTIELIKQMDVPAIFSDYCEEAAHLGACCISTVTQRPLTVAIQLNPFRQPMVVEDGGEALYIPCYSNCFLFGICCDSCFQTSLEN